MPFTELEQEAIILNAAWSMIDDMVNFRVFMPLNGGTENINLMPQTSDALRLFHVLLGDFLSPLMRKGKGGLPFNLPSPPSNTRPSNLTFLFYLRQLCERPKFDSNAQAIRDPLEAFGAWLEDASYIEDVWLPSIGVQASLTVPRLTWLKICADIGKHSFARLESNVSKIVRMLDEHGKHIDESMGYAVLPEFWEWFHTHLFAYHASTIAEFLNNLRWGIYEYLRPEFARAYHVVEHGAGPASYGFDVPSEISAPIAHSMYWELMNMERGKPYFPRFSVTASLKQRY